MLLLADRNFDGYKLWGQAHATGAHLLWRAKGVRILPQLAPLADGWWLRPPTGLLAPAPSHEPGTIPVEESTVTRSARGWRP